MTEDLAKAEKVMTSQDVASLYSKLESSEIQIWLDGGWSVDALLSKQLRPHNDLDIAIQWKDVPKFRELMEEDGYKWIREDSKWNFVLGDDKGREVDVHGFIYDDKGDIVEGVMYPAAALTGTGTINGHTVKCISPEHMIKFLAPWIHKHSWKYLPAVSALCEKFDIDLPEEYKNFSPTQQPKT